MSPSLTGPFKSMLKKTGSILDHAAMCCIGCSMDNYVPVSLVTSCSSICYRQIRKGWLRFGIAFDSRYI
jgi:hypothetical protein